MYVYVCVRVCVCVYGGRGVACGMTWHGYVLHECVSAGSVYCSPVVVA